MKISLRTAVRRRARGRCEYCMLPESQARVAPFQIEHVIARQHNGPTALPNLCLSCHHCNLHKGPNISGVDPLTGRIVRLFHPRRHSWDQHFVWNGPVLEGRTTVGRATIVVLQMNAEDRLDLRQALIEEGLFPPSE